MLPFSCLLLLKCGCSAHADNRGPSDTVPGTVPDFRFSGDGDAPPVPVPDLSGHYRGLSPVPVPICRGRGRSPVPDSESHRGGPRRRAALPQVLY